MKQTAVEWLQEAFEHTILSKEQVMQVIGLFEQAKEMEKEQIIDAYETSHISMMTAERYYNETFNQNKDENNNRI